MINEDRLRAAVQAAYETPAMQAIESLIIFAAMHGQPLSPELCADLENLPIMQIVRAAIIAYEEYREVLGQPMGKEEW